MYARMVFVLSYHVRCCTGCRLLECVYLTEWVYLVGMRVPYWNAWTLLEFVYLSGMRVPYWNACTFSERVYQRSVSIIPLTSVERDNATVLTPWTVGSRYR